MTDPDQPVTITAAHRQWQALRNVLLRTKMSYVGPGADAFAAFQAIEQALGTEQPPPNPT